MCACGSGHRMGVWRLVLKDPVSRLLKGLDWTPQKPLKRATPRNEQAIARWRNWGE
jgi:transposase